MADGSDIVDPAALAGYLEASGWRILRQDERRAIWQRSESERVFVPKVLGPDFHDLLSLALPTIARAEGRSQDDVITDLQWRWYDVLHVRRETLGDGISYQDMIGLHEAVFDLVNAAARAANEPRPSFSGRRPVAVADYLDQLRAVPSLPGSYVVRALLPLSPRPGQEPLRLVGPASPKVRRISSMVLLAADRAVRTAASIADGAPLTTWNDAVADGVSSNLCDALARLGASELEEEPDANVDLRIDWTWAAPSDEVSPVRVTAGLSPVLAAGADFLTGRPEEHLITVTGLITKLHRERPTGAGAITVKGFVDGLDTSIRTIKVDLDEESYRGAIASHDSGTTVQVTALVRRGQRSLEVLHVEDFRVVGRAPQGV